MLDGLTFLPLAEVPAGMTHLRNVAPVELADLVDYFDATYVTGRYSVVQQQSLKQLGNISNAFSTTLRARDK